MFRFIANRRTSPAVATAAAVLLANRCTIRGIAYHPSPRLLGGTPPPAATAAAADAVKAPEAPQPPTQSATAFPSGCGVCGQHHNGGGGRNGFYRFASLVVCLMFVTWFLRMVFGCRFEDERGGPRGFRCDLTDDSSGPRNGCHARDDCKDDYRRGPWGPGPWGRGGPWGGRGRWAHDLPWWTPVNTTAHYILLRAVLPEPEQRRLREEYEQASAKNPTLTLDSFLAKQHPHALDGTNVTQAAAVAAVQRCLSVVKPSDVVHTVRHAARSARDSRAATDAIVSVLERDYPYAFKK